jgi:predicted nucleotidyltransferase
MRLSEADRHLIKRFVAERVGVGATVRLFGSRTEESLRGGDIDLFVEIDHPVESRLALECSLAALLERALDGRRVDVVVAAPNVATRPIDEIARRTGILL